MHVGIAADHEGFDLKQELIVELCGAGHQVTDFGAHKVTPDDDYPDYVIPLAQAVAAGTVERGVALCANGVGASVCANKVVGVRSGVVNDPFSAWQGVEDNHVNVICLDLRRVGRSVAWDLVQTFLAAKFSRAERHLRCLEKVACLEATHSGV